MLDTEASNMRPTVQHVGRFRGMLDVFPGCWTFNCPTIPGAMINPVSAITERDYNSPVNEFGNRIATFFCVAVPYA